MTTEASAKTSARDVAARLLEILVVAVVVIQSLAALAYGWQHPELTQMQVFQAVGEWSIPARWL